MLTQDSSQRTHSLTRTLLATGAIAGPLFMGLVSIQAVTRTGFDLAHHPASLLSLGEFGWIQVANFIVSGLLVVAFAMGVQRALRPGMAGTWGPRLLAAYGLGLIVAGLFKPVPAFGFPPGTPDGVPDTISLSAVLHGIGFTLAFISVTIACLVFARRDRARGRRAWASYALATAAVGLVLSQWPTQEGASVRYFVAAAIVWTWVSSTAVRLSRGSSDTEAVDAHVDHATSRAS
jgi:hypothetical membrane protein